MASRAQIAGQYVFLLFGANGIGSNAASGWVLLVGLVWLAVMTYICYRGIEVSANMQKGLLSIEAGMLVIFAAVALIRVGTGHAPSSHLSPSWSWLNPFGIGLVQLAVADGDHPHRDEGENHDDRGMHRRVQHDEAEGRGQAVCRSRRGDSDDHRRPQAERAALESLVRPRLWRFDGCRHLCVPS